MCGGGLAVAANPSLSRLRCIFRTVLLPAPTTWQETRSVCGAGLLLACVSTVVAAMRHPPLLRGNMPRLLCAWCTGRSMHVCMWAAKTQCPHRGAGGAACARVASAVLHACVPPAADRLLVCTFFGRAFALCLMVMMHESLPSAAPPAQAGCTHTQPTLCVGVRRRMYVCF